MLQALRVPLRTALAATMLVLGLAACGDDEDETATEDTTTTAAGGAAGGSSAAYCQRSLALETIAPPDIDFEALSPEQQKEAVKKFARESVRPLIEEIKKDIPAPIAADAQVLITSFEKLEQTGDFEAIESDPAFTKAEERVHAYDLDNCGWEKTDVAGVDYAYEGLPKTLEAGVHSFEFSNKGKEFHMIALLRAKDGVTESLEDLLQLPEEQAGEKVDFVGETSSAPGAGDYFVADLKPGRYFAVCFIPVGTTNEEEEVDGPPHFTRGMANEVKVS